MCCYNSCGPQKDLYSSSPYKQQTLRAKAKLLISHFEVTVFPLKMCVLRSCLLPSSFSGHLHICCGWQPDHQNVVLYSRVHMCAKTGISRGYPPVIPTGRRFQKSLGQLVVLLGEREEAFLPAAQPLSQLEAPHNAASSFSAESWIRHELGAELRTPCCPCIVCFFCCRYLFVLNILQVSSVALDRAACFFVWFVCLFILNAICKDSVALFYHCFATGRFLISVHVMVVHQVKRTAPDLPVNFSEWRKTGVGYN